MKKKWLVHSTVYDSQFVLADTPEEAKDIALPLMFGCPVSEVRDWQGYHDDLTVEAEPTFDELRRMAIAAAESEEAYLAHLKTEEGKRVHEFGLKETAHDKRLAIPAG